MVMDHCWNQALDADDLYPPSPTKLKKSRKSLTRMTLEFNVQAIWWIFLLRLDNFMANCGSGEEQMKLKTIKMPAMDPGYEDVISHFRTFVNGKKFYKRKGKTWKRGFKRKGKKFVGFVGFDCGAGTLPNLKDELDSSREKPLVDFDTPNIKAHGLLVSNSEEKNSREASMGWCMTESVCSLVDSMPSIASTDFDALDNRSHLGRAYQSGPIVCNSEQKDTREGLSRQWLTKSAPSFDDKQNFLSDVRILASSLELTSQDLYDIGDFDGFAGRLPNLEDEFNDGLLSNCGDGPIILSTTNCRDQHDAALLPFVNMDTYIHMPSPQLIGKIVQLESSEQKPLEPLGRGCWDSMELEQPGTLEELGLDPENEGIISDFLGFVRKKESCKKVGKAWTRFYMLYEPPGTHRSNLIAAMANSLKFDIYDLDLTSLSSIRELQDMLFSTTNRSLIAIRDFDQCATKLPILENELTVSLLSVYVDDLMLTCGDERIIVFTTNHRNRHDAALLLPVNVDTYIQNTSPQPVALPDEGETVQIDSSEHKPLVDFDATSIRTYKSGVLVSNSEKKSTRGASKRQRMTKSVPSFDAPDNGTHLVGAHQSTSSMELEQPENEGIISDLLGFLRDKEFYKRIGKAWKRGYLLYDSPCTDRSSLIAAMANCLEFDIYDLNLTGVSSISELTNVLVPIRNRSIIAIKDFDRWFAMLPSLKNEDWATEKGYSLGDESQIEVISLSTHAELVSRLQLIYISWLGRFSPRPSALPRGGLIAGPIALSSSEFVATNNIAQRVGQDQCRGGLIVGPIALSSSEFAATNNLAQRVGQYQRGSGASGSEKERTRDQEDPRQDQRGSGASGSENERTRKQKDPKEIRTSITKADLLPLQGRMTKKAAATFLGVSEAMVKRKWKDCNMGEWDNGGGRRRVWRPPDQHGEGNSSTAHEMPSHNVQTGMEGEPVGQNQEANECRRDFMGRQIALGTESGLIMVSRPPDQHGERNTSTARETPSHNVQTGIEGVPVGQNEEANEFRPDFMEGSIPSNTENGLITGSSFGFPPPQITSMPSENMGGSIDLRNSLANLTFATCSDQAAPSQHVQGQSMHPTVYPDHNVFPQTQIASSQEPFSEGPVMIKAFYQDADNTIIKFLFPLTSGIVDLKKEVSKRLNVEVDRFVVKYKDKYEDLISILCNEDLMLCLLSSQGIDEIKVLVLDKVGGTPNLCGNCGSSMQTRA